MIRSKIAMGFLWGLLALVLHVVPGAVRTAHGQGSRKDDIVFNSRGVPLAGATIRVCAMPATGQPCTPLALIYSDSALTQALSNPTTSDGLGNYFFYAAPGKYEIEISGPAITTKQIPNVILPNDPASPTFSGGISAFSLTLSGNLTVNGNTTVVGNLASGTLNLTNQSTPPGTATSGTVNLYTKTVDKRLYYKDDAGVENGPLGAGAQTNAVNTFTANQNFDNGMHIKGPDPYADIARFGKFATFSSTTANTTSGSASVALTSGQSFQNGEFVTVYNAGAANSISAMGTVTVTPSLNAGGLNTVAANAGAASFSYKVVAADKFGGYTAASAAASTSTGNTLGVQTVSISTMSRSGRTVTVTTSAAHPFVAGSMVYIQYINGGGTNTDVTFDGFFIVKAVSDSTHFQFDQGFDTAGGATTSDTGGTAIGFTCNHLTWTAVTGAWKYYIYGRTSGSWNLIGVTMMPLFDDFGSPMNDNRTFPTFIPTTAPSVGANDHLTAQIISGGGTTTLALATNAGATLTGAGIVSDDGPALAAACTAFGPPCYVPVTGARVSSFTSIPGNSKMILAGSISTDDTIQFNGGEIVEGWLGASSAAFAWEGTAGGFIGGKAYPQITLSNGPHVFRKTTFSCTASNGCLQLTDFSSGGTVTNVTMDSSVMSTGNGSSTDYLSVHAIFQADGFSFRFDKMAFLTGSPGPNNANSIGQSPIPTVVFKNTNGQAGFPTGNFSVTRSWFVARSSFDQDYVANSNGVNWILFKDIQTQNSFLPVLQMTGNITSSFVGNLDLEDIAPADFPTAVFANLTPNAGTSGLWLKQVNCLSGGSLATTGNLVQNANIYGVCGYGANRDFTSGPFFPNQNVMTNNTGGVGYQLGTPAAPTVAISGGSGPAANTYTYGIVAYDVFGGVSLASPKSSSITVNGSQGVLVTWNLVPGQVATTICRGTAGGALICPPNSVGFKVAGTSFLDNGSGYFPSGSPSTTATGFSAGVGSAGMEGQQLNLTGGGFSSALGGTFTANRTATVPDVTGIVPVSSYLNSAYDNATRANGAIGSNWSVQQNGLNIASNQIQGTTAAQSNSGFWNANSFSPVQFAQATITALNGTSDFPGVTVLASGTGASSTSYDCVENSTTIFMQRVVNAGTTNLTSTASTGAVGDILRLEVGPGGALTCYKNGAVALTATDTQITSGSPGLLISGNVATEKNWSGGNLHPLGHLDVEQDWAKPQHFTQGAAFGTETFTASPRAEQNAFLPGALTATWTGATWTTDKAVTITRVQVQAKTAPAGCATNAIVRLTDGTTPVNITISAAANDSGAISQNYAAGASLQVLVQTAAAGCTTSPADANVTVQYRMQ